MQTHSWLGGSSLDWHYCIHVQNFLGGLSHTLMSSKRDSNVLNFFVQFFGPPKSVCMHLQQRALQQIARFPHCLPPHGPFTSCSRTCYCYSRFSEGSCQLENQVILFLLYYFNGTEEQNKSLTIIVVITLCGFNPMLCSFSVLLKVELMQKNYSTCILWYGYKISVSLCSSPAN